VDFRDFSRDVWIAKQMISMILIFSELSALSRQLSAKSDRVMQVKAWNLLTAEC
jgi:hypothetical protein